MAAKIINILCGLAVKFISWSLKIDFNLTVENLNNRKGIKAEEVKNDDL